MIRAFERHQAVLSALISFGVILLVWQLAVDLGLVNAFFVSTPTRIAAEFVREAASGEVLSNVSVSLYEFVCGLGLAVMVGGALGVLAGWYRTVEYILDPFIWFKYSSPTIAFYPLFIAWLGLGEPTVIAIAFIFALTPIYANTLSGIKNADQDLVRAAYSFGATRYDIFLKVALPGSIPILLAGLRLAIGGALTGVVVTELFGATAGLGYSIAYYGEKLRTTQMMVSIVLVVILGVSFTQVLSRLELMASAARGHSGR